MGRPKKRRRDGELLVDGPAAYPIEHRYQQIDALERSSTGTAELRYDSTSFMVPGLNHSSDSVQDGVVTIIPQDLDIDSNLEGAAINDFSIDLATTFDPTLWNIQPQPPLSPLIPQTQDQEHEPCNCLSLTYLTLSNLQSLPTFSFPLIIPPLRTAMSAISALLHCPTCLLDPFTATQNIQSITSLFRALTSRFSKALLDINAEAARLALNNEKKPFRMGDNSPMLAHLHTGTLDCPMGFNIDLEATDWKKIAKAALRMEVWGGNNGGVCLVGLLGDSEVRQRCWHKNKEMWGEEMRHLSREGEKCPEGKSCESLGAEHIRRAIEGLNWE
ncbi:hypothetical protein NX059_006724 [Plenodomus lindquistii]|nr:hypothetical protein NX059_006724 [Plenodomus lindquistii]